MSEQIVTFLASQQLLTIATADEDGPWICNVYFASDDLTLYFLSMPEARHSVHIKIRAMWLFPPRGLTLTI